MDNNKGRKRYLDIIRWFCALWICFCHFLSTYNYDYFWSMYEYPLKIIFFGITGKFALSMIAVILGFLASKPRDKGVIQYSIERYLQFFLSALTINLLIYGCSSIGIISREEYTLSYVLSASLKIDHSIYSVFWVMRHFLYGSVISFINSKLNEKKYFPFILMSEIIFLLCTQKYWILMCVLGSSINYLNRFSRITQIMKNKIVKIVMFGIVIIAIRRYESDLAYLIDGICSFILIMVISNNESIQKKIEVLKIPDFFLGSYLGLFLIHPLVYEIYLQTANIRINLIVDTVLFLALSSIAAYIVNLVISILFEYTKTIINRILNKIYFL